MERREFIQGILLTVAVVTTPDRVLADDKAQKKGANSMSFEDALKAITGGKEVKDSKKIKFTAPEIAENGAVVPIKVEVDHPMEENNYVKAIHILNTANGNARCADVMLTPANGRGYFSTRIKLSKTQEVVTVVELSDGTFIKASRNVKVTIGGCG